MLDGEVQLMHDDDMGLSRMRIEAIYGVEEGT